MIICLEVKSDGGFFVAPKLDREGDLGFYINNLRENKKVMLWLPRSEVENLRDHLNEVLGEKK